RTYTKEAQKHLYSMEESYRVLSSTKIASQIDIVKPIRTEDGYLKFDFISGKPLDRQLLDFILENNIEASLDLIDKVFSLIDSLPTKLTDPTINKSYSGIFGSSYNGKFEC